MSRPLNDLYAAGVAAIRAGDLAAGREKLQQVLEIDPLHEAAWLWLSAAVETDAERITCLLEALAINPDNEATRLSLYQLGQPPPEPPPGPPPESHSEPPPPPSLLTHAAPRAIDDDLMALLTGSPRPRHEPPPADESWRAPLLDPATMVSDGAFAPPIELEQERTVRQLVGVWANLFLLTAFREFRDEVAYGGFVHVVINLLTAGVLRLVGAVVLLMLLVVLPARGFRPPIYDSLDEFGLRWQAASQAAQPAPGGLVDTLIGAGLLPFDPVQRAADLADAGLHHTVLDVVSSPTLLAVGYAVLAVPLFFVWMIFYSTVVNAAAGMVGGRGDSVQTLHALSLALVVTRAVQLPLAIAVPLLPLAAGLVVGLAVVAYQLLVTAVALAAVQRFGLLASLGVLIMSWGLVGGLIGCCWIGIVVLAQVG